MTPHNRRYCSWGRYPRSPQTPVPLSWRTEQLPVSPDPQKTLLPFGNGRSYGDVCLNSSGLLLHTRGLDRFIAFDPANGVLRCESGVLLGEILELIVPCGWFLPVVPGTKFVTIGGAIANDIHGKNHHSAGSFGCHVRELELLRSDGQRLRCSATENRDLFAATIGGLGLTGLILSAEIFLKQIDTPVLEVETIRYGQLDDFFDLSAASDKKFEYTVAWIDTMARGRHLGRGHFIRANHAVAGARERSAPRHQASIPVELPFSLVTRTSARVFNTLYYRKQGRRQRIGLTHYDPFFFPLDRLLYWNRLYGPRGFHQYQCLLPLSSQGRSAVRELLSRGAHGGMDCFLSVLKIFGEQRSPGLLSFPRAGITLTLDLRHRGERTLRLLEDFDQVVQSAGGTVYPAKDARMSRATFKHYFPHYQELERFRDPRFNSSFWRRTAGG
ncbi:MAG: FAD-binding oxidoreductase [Desulforhopalus sp.]